MLAVALLMISIPLAPVSSFAFSPSTVAAVAAMAAAPLMRGTTRLSSSSSSSGSFPDGDGGVGVIVEYCSACRWMMRGSWIASELLTTFADDPRLSFVTLVPTGPPATADGGVFRICARPSSSDDSGEGQVEVLWDRRVRGRFPEAKEVKQRVRDVVSPDRDLGHSDVVDAVKVDLKVSGKSDDGPTAIDVQKSVLDCVECEEQQRRRPDDERMASDTQTTIAAVGRVDDDEDPRRPTPTIPNDRNRVSIEYSTGSDVDSPDNGLYRAIYYANELLSMMYGRNAWWKRMQKRREEGGEDLDMRGAPAAVESVSLIPNRIDRDVLRIKLNDCLLFERRIDVDAARTMDGSDLREIVKRAISTGSVGDGVDGTDDDVRAIKFMDDDEAEDARRYFGVF
ncbi:hypothetical protein ACHAW5_000711 [Stephanodiscus triporus]|uniref:Selenoprotein O n=1 Tax=Stephanodiscus triporus TaxID=2934178 RepID=A0ABD3PRZ1_9STRA